MEQASPLYSHKGSLSGGTPDTPVSESRRRSEIYPHRRQSDLRGYVPFSGCQKPREQAAGRCPVKEARMAEVQHLIQVSDYEQRLMVNGLNSFRNDLIRDGKPTEDINALLIKVIDAPEKKPKRKFDRER